MDKDIIVIRPHDNYRITKHLNGFGISTVLTTKDIKIDYDTSYVDHAWGSTSRMDEGFTIGDKSYTAEVHRSTKTVTDGNIVSAKSEPLHICDVSCPIHKKDMVRSHMDSIGGMSKNRGKSRVMKKTNKKKERQNKKEGRR